MVNGIPYFGEEHNSIVKHIKELQVTEHLSMSLYDFIQGYAQENDCVYIIDDEWFSWVNDTKFDYKNKKVYIPYFTYKLWTNGKKRRSDNRGHIVRDEDKVFYIRHEYKLETQQIWVNSEVVVYSLKDDKKINITFKSWIDDDTFSIDKLYNLYLVSCYREDDFLLNKHLGGYHYIDRTVDKFSNVEKNLRKEYCLCDFAEGNVFLKSYRDVREFKFEEVFSKEALFSQTETYKIRRINFESYLYCVLRQHLEPEEEDFRRDWGALLRGKPYIKYGNKIKLIIKNYWLDNSNYKNNRTWSRV